MQQSFFLIALTAALGAFASPAGAPMAVEVVERDGQTFVREVVSVTALLPRPF